MAFLELKGIEKSFGKVRAMKGIDLSIERGQFVVFVGPSGCGKSTLLRLIAGLESVDSGTIQLDGRDITRLPPSKRDLAMVFQSYALYPHMSVFDNMSFALRLANVDKAVIQEKVARRPRSSTSPTTCSAGRASSPAASGSASPSAAPSCAPPRSSSSTSRSPTWTRRCAARPAWRSPSSTASWGPPPST
jgi:ABC-type dipeptide/oligopeptide/nickel transport system ATPase component